MVIRNQYKRNKSPIPYLVFSLFTLQIGEFHVRYIFFVLKFGYFIRKEKMICDKLLFKEHRVKPSLLSINSDPINFDFF